MSVTLNGGVTFGGGLTLTAAPPAGPTAGWFGGGWTASPFTVVSSVERITYATDTTGVGTARFSLAAAVYGTDKAIFSYGQLGSPTFGYTSITNLVSNTGIVATDTTGVGTARNDLAAAAYG